MGHPPEAMMPGEKSTENPAESVATALVSRLYDDIVKESCVVFVGAGSTTERKNQESVSFYEEIREKSGYPKDGTAPSFPELMEYFCQHLDGGRHNRLIREAISRIERFSVSGDDYPSSRAFADELAKIPYFNRFVTTNWDPFLERSLEVMIPIVEDRDLAFWDDGKRQVLKIHGCVTRPYSIVATKTDYDGCISLSPLIFNKLRDLMATKTFLFAGYSLRDADFREVWDGIVESLGHFAKLAYAVDPGATEEDVSYWQKRGIQIFRTSDLLFVSKLRARLEKEKLIPSENFLEFLYRERRRIVSIHVNLRQTSAGGLASAMYQDGLLHGLGNVLTSTALGRKKEAFERDLVEADRIVRRMREQRDIIEIAYWSGRTEAIEKFCAMTKTPIPTYFHPFRLHPLTKLVKGSKI
jgi:hypothetical protein